MNFQPVTDFLNQVQARWGVPACECVIWQDHKPLYRYWRGSLDFDRAEPIRGGEWYWMYSCTKPVTMTAVMQLWEQGKLDLEDPVSRYLPEFGNVQVMEAGRLRPAGTVMTIRHLMTMTGGLTYEVESPILRRAKWDTDGSTRAMVAAMAAMPLEFDPGTGFRYSFCHDVAAAVVEVASGERFRDYIENHIAGPLEITGMCFHPGPEKLERMPNQLCFNNQKKVLERADRSNWFRLTERYDSGGAGLCCRAIDYIRFADALACGGTGWNGERILKPETVALMATNQLRGKPMEDYHRMTKPESEGYGLGVRVHMAQDEFPAGEFGWDGAGGALAIMEPKSRLSVSYVQHVSNYLPSYAELHPQLMRLIYGEVLKR